MKTLLLALAGALLLGSTVLLLTRHSGHLEAQVNDSVITQWKQFKLQYNKRYSDPDFEAYRIQIFAQNLEVVNQDTTGTFGVTQFFDLSPAEFAETYLNLKVNVSEEIATFNDEPNDINVNWVAAGKVTRVKNQQQCGSCWAFSTTGAVESALIVAGFADNTLDLSEQQLVDCSTTNYGCNGGWMDNAFEYIETNPLTTESNYPYVAVDQACDNADIKGTLYSLKNFTDVQSGDVNGLKTLLLQQPVAVAVDATNWSYYNKGVFKNCAANLNHGVLLVGFQNGAWLVKNSWGTTWGEQGYIQLADGNTCGIANAASTPSAVPPIN